ncbi:tRNA (N6-isopentenyl adenosine(37)-C2)-methylthiotransferase MiaB [Oerskovia turbata]|uniref:tRNA-2-methylthio-N(6)-dimethylallyladenosine synthase n=2 Tax=Oerskovia turbata TaxID=1713 RepID=A0A4Q1KZJ7_9CELL|nr:tRNA (N6-isopentenyl adenosine(37)-C2)-methylthiotransferase MiaB [Oerskovia turbata]RXR35727.1 tRNA (N6-isopentenyl adenosine(37)-C2)-methylthiotransferase MiaB [Oerskovia turbata]TGJ96698.1 tRNA (N6-isopentenyl adenosine(37)-C2)-methylthiotransferase MiaB [Actinotalea fermentans ATCC 43279 = JCM 9966 = DSM 3133]
MFSTALRPEDSPAAGSADVSAADPPGAPQPVSAGHAGAVPAAAQRTYMVRTLGCQMNVHDSEHMAGMLEQAGYTRAEAADEAAHRADVVVINTCAVRENAATRLYGNLGQLASIKARRPGMQIAVGGCLAQKDRSGIVDKAPWVDVVFGTHNLDALPVLLERARHNEAAQVEIAESLQVFPSTLPTKRESVYAGWVSISVGCNNTCTFCIVPHLRGKERDRRPGQVLAEVQALVDQGAIEVTLLGQNVNSYGVEFGDRGAFAKLLRACGEIEGLERVRFTSPHPAAFTDDVIAAMAETPNVMPQLHMPLQAGSDRVLRAMRRSYRSEKFLGILDRVRAAMPDASITTDLIVGFPGETEEDFAETLRVVEASRFSSAFTFQYSQRPGTPAATLPDQLPKEVVQERYERLQALQDRISAEESARQVGRTVEVLVTEGSGRKDGATHRLTGRAADNRLVHLAVPDEVVALMAGRSDADVTADDPRLADAPDPRLPRPGDMVTVEVTRSAPYHLVADSVLDGGTYAVRRTRSGDAWVAREKTRLGGGDDHGHSHGAPSAGGPVSLGLPSLRRP